jgi:DNA-directed RNA polymerase subunit RPC12/RpoP
MAKIVYLDRCGKCGYEVSTDNVPATQVYHYTGKFIPICMRCIKEYREMTKEEKWKIKEPFDTFDEPKADVTLDREKDATHA